MVDDFDQRLVPTVDELRRQLTHLDGDSNPLARQRLERALALLELSDDYARRAGQLLEERA